MANCLSRTCEPQWSPWIAETARIVYGERQLEALYLQTFITRVNIALDKAIPPDEERVTILLGPGSFKGLDDPQLAFAMTILPDWIVVEGSYNARGAALPKLSDFLKQGRILLVGDTKLIRKNNANGKYTVPGTDSCHVNSLAQMQYYSRNLRTRFGFILSNRELVVAQIIRAASAPPRGPGQRNLRSSTVTEQLLPGLPSNCNSSDTVSPSEPESDDEQQQPSLPTPLPQRKRPHPSTSPETSPLAPRRVQSAPSNPQEEMPSSPPPRTHTSDSFPSSPPTGYPNSLPSSSQNTGSDHTAGSNSDRDTEIQHALIRSISMSDVGAGSLLSYKALFLLIMMVRTAKKEGRDTSISGISG